MAPILGPENGRIFETEGFEKCAHELPVRYHLVPIFALPVGRWSVPQRAKYPASLARQTRGYLPSPLIQAQHHL